MKILILTNHLTPTSGVSKQLFYFLTEIKEKNNFSFTILCGGGDAVTSYKNLCDELIIYPEIMHEKRSIKNFLKSIYKLFRLQVLNRYDLLHSDNHYLANIAQVIAKLTHVKTLQSVHGIIDEIGRLNHYPANYFIAVNEHVKDYLVNIKKKSECKVKIIRCGVKFVNSQIKTRCRKLKIIGAGRLINIKAFDIYIKAIANLPPETKDKADFYLSGKGEVEKDLLNLAKELNVNINFLGEIRELMSYLLTTDILVNPSRSKNEGFPLTIVEAALTRNLVISSNFIGYDSILKNDLNGIIFNVDNVEELSSRLEYAIENYENLNPLIDNLYNLVESEFNPTKMINDTITFYTKILN